MAYHSGVVVGLYEVRHSISHTLNTLYSTARYVYHHKIHSLTNNDEGTNAHFAATNGATRTISNYYTDEVI